MKIFQWASVFSFHRQGKSFLLAICVNKWKEWMIVCFRFQCLELAVFDLSISLSFSVLCLSISLSLFSLGLSFSFFFLRVAKFFFCLKQLISFLYQEGYKQCFIVPKRCNVRLILLKSCIRVSIVRDHFS